MTRPSAENKLSESEINDLKEIATKGIEIYGNSRKFAAATQIKASLLSKALNGRLIVKSPKVAALLEFEFSDFPAQRLEAPEHDQRSIAPLPDALLAEVNRLTGGTRIGQGRLTKMLRAIKALQSA